MTKFALVDRHGSYLSAKEGRFQLYVKDEKIWDVAPVELDAIIFTISGASISTKAIELANEYGVDIVFMNGNKPIARLIQASYGSALKTWLHQLKKTHKKEERVELARAFIEGKIHNQRVVIAEYYKYYRASGKSYHYISSTMDYMSKALEELQRASSVDDIMNLEAQVAREYWKIVSSFIPSEIGFKQRIPRSRQHPGAELDCFNIALNIGYGILKSIIWRAIFLAGLNPYVGFLHKSRSGRMSLVFDLMEEFRPIAVDKPLIAAFRKNYKQFEKLKENDRESVRNVWKIIVNRLYEGKPPLNNITVEQARLLAKHVRGTDVYKPYRAKW
ncbi:MAG: CRISPR-associated endonuclease Cas1 [Candidatus Methanomethyliaceae archaeon]|nr:CRISPR-associated endonuclease Cas1 [Candidatus Methanomethyliaceae archaeon]